MVSTIKTRPNHYEVLGLGPTATPEEIESAFASAVSAFRPRAFGDVAAVSIAYKTLRDPTKRRSYDESIGLRPEPKAPAPVIMATAGRGTAILGSAAAPRYADYLSAPNLPGSEAEAVAEEEPRAFIAAPAPEPASPEPEVRPAPAAEHRIEDMLAIHRAAFDGPHERDGWAEWKRPALTVGSLFLGAALMGVLAGWRTVGSIEQPQPAHAATVGRPVSRSEPGRSVPVETPKVAQAPSAAAPERPTRVAAAPPPQHRKAPQPKLQDSVPADQITEEIKVVNGSSGASDETAAASSEQAASAALPLSNATIARIIGRIGYSCGKVTGTDAVDAANGVFKVTCSSGQSYRASPVRGRYHFRRWQG
jgi:hypothetical protein